MTMFFDSMYQLVDLWASGVNVSFYDWLCELYNNIARWDSTKGCPKFKQMSNVGCCGDTFERIKDDAKEAAEKKATEEMEAAEKLRREAEQAHQVWHTSVQGVGPILTLLVCVRRPSLRGSAMLLPHHTSCNCWRL
jgi:hypothetical protein